MAQGSRPARIGDQIRVELSSLLGRRVKDPGIGFVTIIEVRLTADLQMARVYYTTLGDLAARRQTARALERAKPFLRRQIAASLRLRRTPELSFIFDESVERQDRVERLLQQIHEADQARETDAGDDEREPE